METSQSEHTPHRDSSGRTPLWRVGKTLLLVAFVVAGGTAWWLSAPREPEYQGHELSWWLFYTVDADDRRELTREDFQAMGPAAVKWLPWTAEHGRQQKPSRIARMITALKEKLFHRNSPVVRDEREGSLLVLQTLGPDAAPAISVLQRLLRDPEGEYDLQIADALLAIGPAARTVIEDGLRDGPGNARFALIAAMTDSLEASTEALTGQDVWCVHCQARACTDPDSKVRTTAARALSQLGERARVGARSGAEEIVTPALAALLSGGEADVCLIALEAFPSSSPEAMATIPRLIPFLNHADVQVRIGTAKALTRMLADPDPNVQKVAKEALRNQDVPPGK